MLCLPVSSAGFIDFSPRPLSLTARWFNSYVAVGVYSVVVSVVGELFLGRDVVNMPFLSDKCSSVPVEAALLAVRGSRYKVSCAVPSESTGGANGKQQRPKQYW